MLRQKFNTSPSNIEADYIFNPYSAIHTVRSKREKSKDDESNELNSKTIEFDDIESYIRISGIACYKQGLFSTYNYFKTDRGFNHER